MCWSRKAGECNVGDAMKTYPSPVSLKLILPAVFRIEAATVSLLDDASRVGVVGPPGPPANPITRSPRRARNGHEEQ